MNAPVINPFSLQGKTVLITGASSGVGKRLAIRCAQRGAKLVITGRDKAQLQTTYDQLRGSGHVQAPADLTIAEERNYLAELITTPLNGLVNCAGIKNHCVIQQLRESLMTDMYSINFLAPVMLTQRLLQMNAIAPQGSILFMLSTAAHVGKSGQGAHSAMKSGLLGIIRCLALEQANLGIRVNGISPADITPPPQDAHQQLREDQKARHLLGLGELDDVANGAIYLLSDASRWVTGTSLVIDGGAVI